MGNLELEEARVSTWTESETLILIEEFGNFQMYNGFFLSQFIISPRSRSHQSGGHPLCCGVPQLTQHIHLSIKFPGAWWRPGSSQFPRV